MDAEPDLRRANDAALVRRVRDGDESAFGELYDTWFDRVHDLAFRVTRDSAAAEDVAQDAFLAAWGRLPELDRPEAFGGWLLRIARNRALDHLRRNARTASGDPETMAMIERTAPPSAAAPVGFRVEDRVAAVDDPARAAEDEEIAELVWGAAEALGERDAEVLDLTLRHGMSPAEIAEVIGTNRNAANQIVHRARNRLGDAVRARVLWRRGAPECGDLADALGAAGVTRFGTDAMRVTTEHVPHCALCSERQKLRLDPARMFAAIPVVVAPIGLKQRVAHALMREGVPLDASTAVASPPDSHAADRRDGDGDGDGSDLAAMEPDSLVPPPRRRLRRVLAVAAIIVAVLVGALASIVALADDLDHGSISAERRAPVSTSASTPTTAPATSTSAPGVVTEPPAPETTRPSVTATTAPPPDGPPPPPPPPVATVSLTIQPSTRPATYLRPEAPILTWTSANAAMIEVAGPGVDATTSSGSIVVCPTASSPTWSICVVAPGATYTYVVTARGPGGEVVATASATLTVT